MKKNKIGRPLSYDKNVRIVNSRRDTRKMLSDFTEQLYVLKFTGCEIILDCEEAVRQFIDIEAERLMSNDENLILTEEDILQIISDDELDIRTVAITESYKNIIKDLMDRSLEFKNKMMQESFERSNIPMRVNDLFISNVNEIRRIGGIYAMPYTTIVGSRCNYQLQELEKFARNVWSEVYHHIYRTVHDLFLTLLSTWTDKIKTTKFTLALNKVTEAIEQDEDMIEEKSKYVYRQKTYKELHAQAIENGWELVRNRGDHGIYKSASKTNLLVIPQGRVIGKGLQMLIERSM